ncbi:UvrD-helicase domain-containing protein [Aromatoleum buckelii]|uniref:UvrD-helicase domain-containing protein n=1 Tax=Aromatoleum buckelii TaxID=200254 RepID=UPI001FF46272|nr:ATP-dependent helicase [Aromatoleum buckelii]MCK0510027.1 ATP-dependent helicase [Aromatoleum buckelii]
MRRDAQVDFDPDKLTRLLKSFAEPFGDGVEQRGFFALRPQTADSRYLKLLRPWKDIETIRERRMRLARALVQEFQRRRQGNTLLVTCKQGELEAALQADTTLADLEIDKWDVALSAALLYLDANEVLHLARGKAVFRSAMSIALNAEARRRQFKKSDYAELALHYKDKIVQVHVMAEYAKLAVRKIQAAMAFIVDYFSLDRAEFVRRYFAGRKDVLEMATTEAAHRRILTDLANPEQQAIVAAPLEGNHLVLAGPGAGKTKVIVHRVAWLLRECMVLPEAIMVLAYNRSAANEIRRRLWALVGTDAAGVAVQTLHGLAMRLTGTSYAVAIERGEAVDFSDVIRQATRRLRAAEQEPSVADGVGPSILRDRLLSGLRFLLVDEYQDINGDHYELISAVAGRTLQTEEDRVSLMVVGDDDQNIYAFDGASVRFIRQFETDYAARRYALIENYRSTKHIIHCANRVIERARERMKGGQAIRVNHARRDQPDGGEHAALDPLTEGRVNVLEVPRNPQQEAQVALDELQRLHDLLTHGATGAAGQWGRFAVIARRWEDLEPMAALCRVRGIPVRMQRDAGQVSLHQTREGNALVTLLRGQRSNARRRRVLVRAGVLSHWFRRRFHAPPNGLNEHPYRAALAQFIVDAESAAPGRELVVDDLIESLYDFGAIGKPTVDARPNAPLVLMTAHRAKGLEFDHVLILDGGGWQGRGDDERRLFYVAMTRARKSLTLCEAVGGQHPFVRDLDGLVLRSRPEALPPEPGVAHRIWCADPEKVVLSWPGRFSPTAPIHRALAALDVGSPLALRPRSDGRAGWEITDASGVAVGRMSSKFQPPEGAILAVRVAAVLVRGVREGEEGLQCQSWELVLPEIEYVPG